MSTLFAKNGFSRPSLKQLCGVFRDVLGLRLPPPSKTFVTSGVNVPQLQTIIVIVNSYYIVLLPNTMLAKEIHQDSLKKRPTFSACNVSQRSFPCPAGKRRR